MEWRFRTGQFESIRWAGSRSVDPLGLSPWWAGGIIFGLLHEMPQEYKKHAGAYVEVKAVIYVMNKVRKAPAL
ncbi:hypothetical protein BT69DRAFT_1289682, partial [Atractiella rhizophila]